MTHDLKSYPRLLFVITGKGPMKEMYRERMSKMSFRKVAFRTMWLTAEDYPRMVSAADLGVSLHVSSSGFDLPMKVVDMFGCGVPVCSANYTCVEELVHNDRNGMLFNDAQELAEQLKVSERSTGGGWGGLLSLVSVLPGSHDATRVRSCSHHGASPLCLCLSVSFSFSLCLSWGRGLGPLRRSFTTFPRKTLGW